MIIIIIHARAPNIEGMNGDVKSDLSTVAFMNREELEDFISRIIRLQQKINLSKETISPTRLLFQYMKALSKIDKLKKFIETKMTDLITFLYKNLK